jgi:hypothetical protein
MTSKDDIKGLVFLKFLRPCTLVLNSRVLLMYTDKVKDGEGAAGLSCTGLSIWEFGFVVSHLSFNFLCLVLL